jgi:outer membrane protein
MLHANIFVLLDIEQVRVNEITMHSSQYQLDNTRKQVIAGSLPELNAAELEARWQGTVLRMWLRKITWS